ncbi:MAG: GTPase ObgE [Eubacteriales bacterium]|nr:GTPase ObgE [Eubacteriales bacterium]
MPLFVDKVNIRAQAGNGGNGCVSFHREKFVQAGGPDGGDGGRGGDVILVASKRLHTLMDFRYKRSFAAGNGADGSGSRRTGTRGENVTIEVPRGTVVRDADTGRILADMTETDKPRVLLRGGNGGYGNQHFATPTRQAPNYAKPGERGRSLNLVLELKSIADLGLVGFPNVGKSTILSVVTSAKPKIANYHFTTLQPNLGIVEQDGFSFIMADIPGIVEGASDGVGLGFDFLRHIERTRMLLHVIDISGSEDRDPLDDYDAIMKELEAYGDLKNKPMFIAANKIDLPGAEENLERLREKLKGENIPIYPVSAATRQGFTPLMRALAARIRELPEPERFEEEELEEEKTERSFQIAQRAGAYEVTGTAVTELVRSVNFGDEDSLQYFHRSLRKLGIIDALRRAGAGEGDTVRIEGMGFEFME